VIALGIILLLVAALLVVLMLTVGFGATVTFGTFAGNVVTRPFWIFLLGAATMLIALMGLSLMQRGTRRKVQRRREIKRLRRVEQEAQTAPPASRHDTRDTGVRPGPDDGRGDDGPDRTLVRDEPLDRRTPPSSV
jgi:hypothetical protein